MLTVSTCTSSMGKLCSYCFGGNIISPFLWVHLPVTGFIEEVDDLSLYYVNNVRY